MEQEIKHLAKVVQAGAIFGIGTENDRQPESKNVAGIIAYNVGIWYSQRPHAKGETEKAHLKRQGRMKIAS